jgi:outer membrane protein, multidrug efflux system
VIWLRRLSRRGGTAAFFLCLFGCAAVGPNYRGVPQHTTADLPSRYKNRSTGDHRWKLAVPNEAALGGEWWLIFNDRTLNRLENSALANNQDLRTAVNRIDEAQAQVRLATADLLPNVGANGKFNNQRTSSTDAVQRGRLVGSFSGFGGGAGGSSASPIFTGSNGPLLSQQPVSTTFDTFQQTVDLSWELDLFGRVRRNVEAAKANRESAEDDLLATQLSVTANLANQYFMLHALDSEAAILERTIATRQDALRIAEERLNSGLTSELDVQRAKSDVASDQADLYSVMRARGELENGIATLAGQPASNLVLARAPQQRRPPAVPVGLPSTLLERRPDVASAERSVAAANARVGVAVAAFYPDVRLSGAAGFETANIGDIFAGQSLIWSVGPSITVPIFEGGRNSANLQNARAQYEETVNRYRAQVLTAFQDVENALIDLHTLAGQASAQDAAVTAARRALELSQQQYEKGAVGFLDVLDAERTLLQDERVSAQLLGARLQVTVQLIKALGGTWGG